MSASPASISDRDDDDFVSEPEDDTESVDPNGDDNDDPPPSRGRKRLCPSSTVISTSVRNLVRGAASGECWLCGLTGCHVAHILGKADIALFQTYKAQGLFNMHAIHAIDNLIYFCAGCHHCFDERVPAWAFLPVDLDTIITTEVDFHRARDAAAANGVVLRRPTLTTIPNLPYARYQTRPKRIFDHVFLDVPTKNWIGSPTAVILRNVRIAAGQTRLPAAVGGLPADVSLKLQHLLHLYATPPPEVQNVSLIPRPLGVVATASVGDKKRRKIPHRRTTSSQHPPAHPSEEDSSSNQDTKRKKIAATNSPVSNPVWQREVRRRRRGNGTMMFGPHMTADMLSGLFAATQVKGIRNSR
ncbi:hypothetical protein Q9L58_000330 [Maublancomyces gigas]|uniref:HNH endonuclease n=1 Tax=Discina gigas TaxID=1032678 RepID=A0ABR3GXY7_9PEZI